MPLSGDQSQHQLAD